MLPNLLPSPPDNVTNFTLFINKFKSVETMSLNDNKVLFHLQIEYVNKVKDD